MKLGSRYIELKDVTLAYERRVVLNEVSLLLNRGDFMLLSGPNGGGKTSLLRLMLALQKPTKGRLFYYSQSGEGETPHLVPKICDSVGYLPQKSALDLRFPMTIREIVESGLIGEKRFDKTMLSQKVDEMMSSMQLDNLQNYQIGEVSGGQFQRALFARAIISQPSLLVLDEPTSYLDKEFSKKVCDTLQQLSSTTTIVVVMHNENMVSDMATRTLRVENGQIIQKNSR